MPKFIRKKSSSFAFSVKSEDMVQYPVFFKHPAELQEVLDSNSPTHRLTVMGYARALESEKSQRAERIAKQALEKLSLPVGKDFKDAAALLCFIRVSSTISWDEIGIIADIITCSIPPGTNIIFYTPCIEAEEALEVQILAGFDIE